MSRIEQKHHIDYIADSHIEVAEKYHHSAIFVHPNPWGYENIVRLLGTIRGKSAMNISL